jgi:hypothetical protein
MTNLEKGKTYRFVIYYNLEEEKEDRLPHYYIGKFVGKEKRTFIFENFKNQENINAEGIRKKIKFFRGISPSFEEVETPKTEVKGTKRTKTSSKGGAFPNPKKNRTTRRRR